MKRPLAIDPRKAAMLFIDLQEEHRSDQRLLVEGFDAVLKNARRLRREAWRAEIPVFHFAYVVDIASGGAPRHHPRDIQGGSYFSDKSSPLTEICAEMKPAEGETLIVKAEASAFGNGQLVSMLERLGVEWVFVSGVWTEACVDATVRDAVRLGYRVALIKDACASGTAAMHRTGILNLANRLYGGAVVETGDACTLMMGLAVKAWQTEEAVPLRYTFENASGLYDGL